MKILLGILGVILLIALYFLYKLLRKMWLKYQANRDRSYNVFDKAEFTAQEKINLKKWAFTIPKTMKNSVIQNIR